MSQCIFEGIARVGDTSNALNRDRGPAPPHKREGARPLVNASLSKSDPRDDTRERIAADGHSMMALIAAQAEKATAPISGKEGRVRTHDRHVTGLW